MLYVEFMKNFLLANPRELLAVRVISVLLSQKTFDSYFVDMIYVEFHKKFSSLRFEELFGVTLMLAS